MEMMNIIITTYTIVLFLQICNLQQNPEIIKTKNCSGRLQIRSIHNQLFCCHIGYRYVEIPFQPLLGFPESVNCSHRGKYILCYSVAFTCQTFPLYLERMSYQGDG